MFPKMPFLVHKGRPSKINKRNSFFLKFGFSGIEYGMHVFKDDFWRQFSNGPHKKKSFLEKCIWDEGLKYSSALLNVGFIHKGLQKSTHNHCRVTRMQILWSATVKSDEIQLISSANVISQTNFGFSLVLLAH